MLFLITKEKVKCKSTILTSSQHSTGPQLILLPAMLENLFRYTAKVFRTIWSRKTSTSHALLKSKKQLQNLHSSHVKMFSDALDFKTTSTGNFRRLLFPSATSDLLTSLPRGTFLEYRTTDQSYLAKSVFCFSLGFPKLPFPVSGPNPQPGLGRTKLSAHQFH